MSGTAERLRGISAANNRVGWASGTHGTVLRTTNGGRTWDRLRVPASEQLDFRDIQALSADVAYLLSIGPGESSRIYKTSDGGKSWSLQFRNKNSKAFFDCMAFWDANHGIALSDPVEGKFVLITTADGAHWDQLPPANLPPALEGEGAFAASGSCIAVQGKKRIWFATGGATVARVFRSSDRGKTWQVAETPIHAGSPSSGIFSIAFRDANHGIVVGGDYKHPDRGEAIAAITQDGGKSWQLTAAQPQGYRSSVSCVCRHDFFAVGSSGSDLGFNDGKHWSPSNLGAGYNALAFEKKRNGWAVGEEGKIAYAPTLCAVVDAAALAQTKK